MQVVQTVKTDTFSASVTTANSTPVTGLSATITPSSTSSKILALISLSGSHGAGYGVVAMILTRDGTDIGVGDAAGSRARVSQTQTGAYSQDGNTIASLNYQFLDSPSSTSALTYAVEAFNPSSTTQNINVNRDNGNNDAAARMRTASTITLMEVAG